MNKLQVLVSGISLTGLLAYLVFFTSPESMPIIVLFIVTVTLLTFLVSTFFVERKYQYLITIFILSFLTINYIAGFQILNTTLLISIIIGLAILIK